jgi:hypothetical protein
LPAELLARTGGDAHDLRTQVDEWIRTNQTASAWRHSHPNPNEARP